MAANTQSRGLSEGLVKTVGRMDAAVELTRMYLQRVFSRPSGRRHSHESDYTFLGLPRR